MIPHKKELYQNTCYSTSFPFRTVCTGCIFCYANGVFSHIVTSSLCPPTAVSGAAFKGFAFVVVITFYTT